MELAARKGHLYLLVFRASCRLARPTRLMNRREESFRPRSQSADGGADRDRTDDLRLAKPALSQLSYSPENVRSCLPDQPAQPPRPPFQLTQQAHSRSSLDKLTRQAHSTGSLSKHSRELRGAKKLVGLGGFEPPTSRLSGGRSNQLSYRPAPRGRSSDHWLLASVSKN